MDWLTFLNALENTLNQIEVKGKENLDCMYGCFIAIDKARQTVLAEQKPPEEAIHEINLDEEK